MLRFNLILAFCLLLVGGIANANSPIKDSRPVVLQEASERVNISRNLSYFEDAADQYAIEDIVSQWPSIANFERPDQAHNFGFSESPYWFHTRLHNRDGPSTDWVLEGMYSIIDRVDLYVVRSSGDIEHYVAGDAIKFDSRGRKHHNINFRLDLEQGETVDLFFRVETTGSVMMPLLLWTNEAFSGADHQERFVFGLYYGLLLCMAVFNLLIFLSTRDSNYLWYVSYIVFYGLLQLTVNGLAFEHLWPEMGWWNNRAISFFIAMGMFSILGFSRSFLLLQENVPWLNRVIVTVMAFFPFMAVAALAYPDYGPVIRITTFVASVSVLFILAGGLITLYQGFRPARYFMIAWSALLAGMMLYTLKTFGLLPANFLTEYAIQIGSAFEAVLLSLAMAARLRLLMLENQRIQEEMNLQLEQRVSERTSELEVVNRKLEALSATDGLTGLYNRRFFDERLDLEVGRSSRNGPLSLLMIDVDLFKPLNDTHGHLAGDSCLRKIASVIAEGVSRRADVVARYGGEEFAVILPDTGSEGAKNRAEAIRKSVADNLNFFWSGQAIDVTVSVGVATVAPGGRIDADDMIDVADRALYDAKQEGRNTVVYRECIPEVPPGAAQISPV
ncbi:7TM diverse intracellular signaling domain-containing protein [Marinobacter sp. CHS3-4]|uniref:sensor domain-containing diguanylate cyclase n=1 Tax=Marinobacter sp. CHS3-4 TaxID=3045174 RepID=UPI0024B57C85|nr:7TM diverse intracellular signaling domain-containing protein [Marinobacter sp. CHS3-4]MDI9244508.1 7TM diverse intracellular signaling domain-containing protein [Marinobacter sp. CHS3-4]